MFTHLRRSLSRLVEVALALISTLIPVGAFAMEPDVLYEKLSPSVWVVYPNDGEGVRMGSGSGVVIAREQMVTNCHVLLKAKAITVKRENTSHQAQLMAADMERDLCLLKVPGMVSPTVEIAPISAVKVGQWAIAIGAPRGLELTLSDGLISSLRKDEEGRVQRIQISVPISHGSSGGGLFDRNGKLIGITSSGYDDAQNLNFAIPAEWIKAVPGRAALALAKMREDEKKKPAVEKVSAKQGSMKPNGIAPGTASTTEAQLLGAEFLAHINQLGTVDGVKQNGSSYRFTLDAHGHVLISNMDRGSSASGIYSINASDNQLCLTVFGAGTWGTWSDCYRLFSVGNGQFVLRAVTDLTFFRYSKS